MNPPIKLPFSQSNTFPKDAFANTNPTWMKRGVEARAAAERAAQPRPAVHTRASDAVAALGRNPAVPAPALDLDAQLWGHKRPATPASPLGGLDPRPISSRGGPISYSQRGVGTTNPNAYAVGQRHIARMLQRAGKSQHTAPDREAQWAEMMFGQPARPAPSIDNKNLDATLWGAKPAATADPNADFWAAQDAALADFWKTQETSPAATTAQDKQPVDIFAMEGAGGYVPMIRSADGSIKAAGGFFPGAAPDPGALPELPLTAQQREAEAQRIAAEARAQEEYFTKQGLILQPPQKATDAAGRTYAPPASEPDQIAVNADGKTMKIPAGYQPPAGFSLLEKASTTSPAAPNKPAKPGQTSKGRSYKIEP